MGHFANKERPFTVRIFYKSGNSIDVNCKSITVDRSIATGGITELRIENEFPRGLYMHVDEIEAIWTTRDDTGA